MGRTVIVEHKTSGEDITPGSNYWARLRMDGQVSGYFRGAEALGHPAEACVYDVLGKPGQKPLKATPPESRKYTKDGALYKTQRDVDETPEEYRLRVREAIAENPAKYFQRLEIVRLEDDMIGHDIDTWQQSKLINESRLASRFPRNPDACQRYGSMCGYFAVCAGEASIDDPNRFRKRETAHPELKEGVTL